MQSKQVTFTEEDVRNLQGFLQFVADRAVFRDLDWADAIQLSKYRAYTANLLRLLNDHIMELRAVVEPAETESTTTSKKTKK